MREYHLVADATQRIDAHTREPLTFAAVHPLFMRTGASSVAYF